MQLQALAAPPPAAALVAPELARPGALHLCSSMRCLVTLLFTLVYKGIVSCIGTIPRRLGGLEPPMRALRPAG